MRVDEEFVKDKIVASYLESEFKDFLVTPGDDPPDYFITISNDIIALEITQCNPFIYNTEHKVESAVSFSEPILKYVDDLCQKYKHYISAQECILFTFHYTIEKFTSFKRDFTKIVEKLCVNNFNGQDHGEIVCKLEVIIWKRLIRPFGKRMVGMATAKSKNFCFNIVSHITQVLRNAIAVKTLKMKGCMRPDITKMWLGILNNYFLADLDSYKQAIELLGDNTVFEKIFVVDQDGRVLISNCT